MLVVMAEPLGMVGTLHKGGTGAAEAPGVTAPTYISCPWPRVMPMARDCPAQHFCLSLCSRCDLCCCLIPCLFDDFKDVTHTCPNCKAYIYTYKRMC